MTANTTTAARAENARAAHAALAALIVPTMPVEDMTVLLDTMNKLDDEHRALTGIRLS